MSSQNSEGAFDPENVEDFTKEHGSIIEHELKGDIHYKEIKSMVDSLKRRKFRIDEVYRTTDRINAFVGTQKAKRFDKVEKIIRALHDNEQKWAKLKKEGISRAHEYEKLFRDLRIEIVKLMFEMIKEVDVLVDYEGALVGLANQLSKSGSKKISEDLKAAMDELAVKLADLEELGLPLEDKIREARLKRKAQFKILDEPKGEDDVQA